MKKPNFPEIVSEHFNGAAGDTTTLYEVAKFLSKIHQEWIDELQQLIDTMKEKDFYEEIILEEIEKWIEKRSSNP